MTCPLESIRLVRAIVMRRWILYAAAAAIVIFSFGYWLGARLYRMPYEAPCLEEGQFDTLDCIARCDGAPVAAEACAQKCGKRREYCILENVLRRAGLDLTDLFTDAELDELLEIPND